MKYGKELESALEAAEKAGKGILEIYEKDVSVEMKEDQSPVTQADYASEKIILSELEEFDYSILSEEAGFLDGKSEHCWVIDPLDGTKDFIQKTGEYSIMIGLVKNRVPVLGVVHAPSLNKIWYAVEGEGAHRITSDGIEKIKTSSRFDLKDYRLLVSRNHLRESDKKVAQNLGISRFKRMGSVGVKYSTLAEGNAELCVYTTGHLKLWDCCGPHIILKEAGGDVLNKEGQEPGYDFKSKRMKNGFIGTNGKNKEKIVKAL